MNVKDSNSYSDSRDHSLETVPQGDRKSFFAMLVVMLGFTFFSASMWAGGKLGTGLTFGNFMLAVLAGNLVLGIYTGTLSVIAAKTGLSTHLLSRYSFGEKGSWLPSLLLGVTQVGWFGVGVVMFALPVQKVTGLNIYLIIILSGIIMTFTAWFGIKALTILSFIAVPAITILGFTSVGMAVDTAGGLSAITKIIPDNPITISAAIGICVASFISGGTLTPDFTRYAKSVKTAVSTTVIAFFLGNSLMFLFGAVGAMIYKQADISEVMLLQGMIIPAMFLLGLNIWTTNDNALYASGLGFSNITGLPKRYIVIFNGLAGTAASLYLYNNFIGFLNLLNTMLPSIGAVIIADYFILNKGKYQDFSEAEFPLVKWNAMVAWGCGFLAARYVPGIAPVNSVAAAFIVYVAIGLTGRKFFSR